MQSDREKLLSYERIEKVKIDTNNLKIGMFVCELDRPWDSTPFVFQGFLLQSEKDLVKLRTHCDWVYVDVVKSTLIRNQGTTSGSPLQYHAFSTATVDRSKRKQSIFKKISRTIRRVGGRDDSRQSLRESLKPAVEVRHQADKVVKSIMHEVRLGRSIDTPAAKETIAACVDSVIRNKDAMLLLSRLRDKDEYTSEHCLNVAVVSIAFGRHLGMNRAELNEIGLCGLLHDMGKLLIPDEVLNKPGRLTQAEMELMKQHTVYGREVLLASKDVMDCVIDVAYGHHERMDGTGYPQGKLRKGLSQYNRMIAIADVYDAITGDRIYRMGKTSEEALQFIHNGSRSAFDLPLVIKFIENIGIYPLGTIVETQNGEIGIVVENNPTHRLRPRIKLLFDEKKFPIENERFVDLGRADTDSRGNPYMIKLSHNPGSFGVDLTQHIASYIT